jgi:hypothetical protein
VQLPTRQPPRRTLTASASRLRGKDQTQTAKRVAQPWQERALAYYDQIGEIRFSSQFYARQLSRVRMFPAVLEPDGDLEPIEEGRPVELLNRVQDPGGKRSRLQYDYGRLMFVTGEGILLVTGEDSDLERWRFLWRDEVKIFDDGRAVRLNWQRQETGETGTAYRMWTPHPRQSDLADSPMHAVLDIAEELIILTESVRGTATTRLTNGILALASELSPSPADGGSDEDPNENIFLADYIEHVQAQIENPGAPESKVPFLLEGSFDYIREGIKWIQTHNPETDYMERDLRIEAVKRLALGLDFPPEVLLGMSDSNHWTALQVQQDMWRSHGAAIAEQMAHDFAEAYLRPALRDEGYSGWEQVVIGYDDSQVVISPDRSADADNAATWGNISDEGYRELKGIPESMAPSEDEKALWAAIKVRDIGAVDGLIGLRGPAEQPEPAPSGEPSAPPEPSNGRVVSRQEARTAAIVGAAHLALRQCRNRAGARLRQDHRGCKDCAAKIDGIPNSMVASALGARKLKALGAADSEALVKGGADEFRGILTEWGLDDTNADTLAARVEFYAAKTLTEKKQPELPPGFEALVEAAQEVREGVAA